MELSEKQIEENIVKKQKSITASVTGEALSKFLETPAYNVRNIQVIRDEMALFGTLLSKISEAEFDKVLGAMGEDRAAVLLEYMHRYMEFVGGEQNLMSGNALKFYEKVINVYGKGIILKAGFKTVSLVNRSNNNYQATAY